MTTHFPHGVTNAESSGVFGRLPIPDPGSIYMFHDDFMLFAEPPYDVTIGVGGVFAWVDALGGAVEFVTDTQAGAEADLAPLQKGFEFIYGREIWYRSMHTVVGGDDGIAMHFGLQGAIGADPLQSCHFNKTDGQDWYHIAIRNMTVQTDFIRVADFVVGEEISLGFHWDGVDRIDAYADNVLAATIITDDASGNSPELPQIPTGTLFPTFGVVGNGVTSETQLNSWTIAEEL